MINRPICPEDKTTLVFDGPADSPDVYEKDEDVPLSWICKICKKGFVSDYQGNNLKSDT